MMDCRRQRTRATLAVIGATRSQFLVASWKRQLIVDADPPGMIEQRHAERV
jgi:hypothetical protein